MFKIKPVELEEIGNQILEEADAFDQRVKMIYESIDEMIRNNFQSPDAIALANKIESYKSTFINLTMVIREYGEHCKKSAKLMAETNTSLIDGINT